MFQRANIILDRYHDAIWRLRRWMGLVDCCWPVVFHLVYTAQFTCNPFDIPGYTWSSHRKSLRPVTAWICKRAPHITIGMQICNTCRKKPSKESPDATKSVTTELAPPTPSSQATESDLLFYHGAITVSSLNVCLAEIGKRTFSPVKELLWTEDDDRSFAARSYHRSTWNWNDPTTEREILGNKDYRSKQVQVLTVLPKRWSVKKVQQEFGTSEYVFGTAVKEAGRGKRQFFSSWYITLTFTATRNSYPCL